MLRTALLTFVAGLPLVGSAQVPSPQPAPASPVVLADPTAHRHLGFFLRLDVGVGYLGSMASASGVSPTMSGATIPGGITIGGAVAENLILAGEMWGAMAVSPAYGLGGTGMMNGASRFGLGGVGPNLTYYLMPENVYFSVTPSVVGLGVSGDGTSHRARAGFGLKAGIGKEWWVGDHWGLGIAGQFFLGINADGGQVATTWTTLGGAVAFSATYN